MKIREDWPREIEERRNTLWPYFKAAQNFKDADGGKVKARLAVDKLIINKESYSADNLEAIPKQFHPTGCVESENTIAFFSRESPLSNFYTSQFSSEKMVFSSVEQYLVFKKATLFNDADTAEAVMSMSDPVKIKARGKRVKNFDHKTWANARIHIMEEALELKFSQSQQLKIGRAHV